MAPRSAVLLSFLLTTGLLVTGGPGFGQIIIPGVGYPGGGYPGGGYPSGGYPGGRRYPQNYPPQSNRDEPSETTLTGIVRKTEDNKITIETDDKTITPVTTSSSTKYTSDSGASAKIGDFQPGDRVSIETKEDNKKVYHARKVRLVKEGTTDEHAIASQSMDDPLRPLPDNFPGRAALSASNSSSSSSSGGSGHPTLRRAANSDSSSSDRASNNSGSSGSSSSSASDNDPDRPILRRSSPSSNSSNSSSNSASSNYPGSYPASNSGGSGDNPPQLRRAVSNPDGSPKAEIEPADSTGSQTVASARPSIQANDSNGVTRLPSPPQTGAASAGGSYPGLRIPDRTASSADPVIDQAREAAFSFTETLPNYIVKQYTTRYATMAARGGRTSWQTLDVVTADVIEEDGNEKYKNILVNGRPPREDVEKSGSWSKGEYSSLQLDVLSPLTNADFHGKRTTTIVNRAAYRYDFSVLQQNSHWHVESESQSYMPAYTGSIWIDKENYRVLRIELAAQDMPRSFPLDQVESAVDYDYVYIGEGKFLLPVHSEALSCERGTNDCSRNVIEFRNYRKFTADTSITFDQ